VRQLGEEAAQEKKMSQPSEVFAKEGFKSDKGTPPARPQKWQEAGNARTSGDLKPGTPTSKPLAELSAVETQGEWPAHPTYTIESRPTDRPVVVERGEQPTSPGRVSGGPAGWAVGRPGAKLEVGEPPPGASVVLGRETHTTEEERAVARDSEALNTALAQQEMDRQQATKKLGGARAKGVTDEGFGCGDEAGSVVPLHKVDSLEDVERDESTPSPVSDPNDSGLSHPAVAACATWASVALVALKLVADDSITADVACFGIGPASDTRRPAALPLCGSKPSLALRMVDPLENVVSLHKVEPLGDVERDENAADHERHLAEPERVAARESE